MSTTVARRYAQALIEQAATTGSTDAVDADVRFVQESLRGSKDLVLFFESPVISRERKKSTANALFEAHLGSLTMDFLMMLIDKRREELLSSVLSAYGTLRDHSQGVAEADIRTARPLSGADVEGLQKRLESLTGLRLRMQITEDKGLLGGIVVRIGDTVYDGSVAGSLASLKERLSSSAALLN